MCQLLGMNCNVPTDIQFSFRGFRQRSGITGEHGDGFGIGFFEGRGCRTFLDHQAACRSPVAQMLDHYAIKSLNVIAHIRKATQGEVKLENCHPFQRELWGEYWLFAHNGDLKNLPAAFGQGHHYRPVGDTDSEQAFCHLLNHLRQHFDTPPSQQDLFTAIAAWASQIAQHGTFNFMLSNGRWLIVHCSSKLSYLVRQAPFQTAHLLDEDVDIDFSTVTTPADRVAVIATEPLTDNEAWTPLQPGELLLFEEGTVRFSHLPEKMPAPTTMHVED